jgi:hypothetical protein
MWGHRVDEDESMNLDEEIENLARARRKRIGQFLTMLAGDSVVALAVVLGYLKLLAWPLVVVIIVLGLAVSAYMMWRIVSGRVARSEP